MAGLNKVTLIGHLGADPEIRRTQDGRPVAQLRLATSETWRDKASGERRERTEWHRITVFNEGLCKVAEQYLKKGAKIYVEGTLSTRKWTDVAGIEKFITEIVVKGFGHTILMLDRVARDPGAQSEDEYGTASTGTGGGGGFGDDLNDEVPF